MGRSSSRHTKRHLLRKTAPRPKQPSAQQLLQSSQSGGCATPTKAAPGAQSKAPAAQEVHKALHLPRKNAPGCKATRRAAGSPRKKATPWTKRWALHLSCKSSCRGTKNWPWRLPRKMRGEQGQSRRCTCHTKAAAGAPSTLQGKGSASQNVCGQPATERAAAPDTCRLQPKSSAGQRCASQSPAPATQKQMRERELCDLSCGS